MLDSNIIRFLKFTIYFKLSSHKSLNTLVVWPMLFGTRDLFNISYSRELYLFSKFLHFEEIVREKIAVHFEIIVIEAYTTF